MRRRTVRTRSHLPPCLPHMPIDMVLETLNVDFKPLYQSIHIYTTLDSLDELRKSYQADRKVRSSMRRFALFIHSLTGPIRSHPPRPAAIVIASSTH
jgi:hypothetical protein